MNPADWIPEELALQRKKRMTDGQTEMIACPFCNAVESSIWAKENGFTAVRCRACQLIYVNPRPKQELISEAVKTGNHSEIEGGHNVVTRRNHRKVAIFRNRLARMFSDVWKRGAPISWLDVGAGFGEFVESVSELAPQGSCVQGIEPMRPKVEEAQRLGINVVEEYLSEIEEKFDFVSLINVFSHVPDFRPFILEMRNVLNPGGEIFLETGNIGDLGPSEQVPTELDLPDHLVFAGEKHVVGYLEEAGFEVIRIERQRKDTAVNFCKNVVKKVLQRRVFLRIPYTSPYRALFFRARLRKV